MRQRSRVIYLFLVASPVICILIGLVAKAVSGHQLNDDGTNWSLALPYLGFILGLIGSLIGLVVGTIIASLTRKSKSNNYALCGYLLPASLPILYMLYALALNI